MSLRRTLRSAPLVLAGLATLGVCLPVATGHWDPAWLRVGKPDVSRSVDLIGVPDVQAPFRAEQRDLGGLLLWRLSGDRVVSRSLREHDLEAPRLQLFQLGRPVGSVKAARGEVTLPQAEQPWLEIALSGGVTLEGGTPTAGAWRVETRRLRLRLHEDGPQVEGGVKLACDDPLTLSGSLGEARWQAQAPSLRGSLGPLDVRLGGPTKLTGDPLMQAVWPEGRRVHGVAHGGLRLRGDTHTPPRRVRLDVKQLELTVSADGGRLTADALDATWELAPTRMRAALGGMAGVHPSPVNWAGEGGYALRRVRAREVTLEARREAREAQGALKRLEGLDLTLSADRWEAWALSRRMRLEGSPARLEEALAGAWLEAPAVEVRDAGGVFSASAHSGAAFGFREAPVDGAPGPRWSGQAERLSVEGIRPARDPGENAAGAPPRDPTALDPAPPRPRLTARDLLAASARGLTIGREDGEGLLQAAELDYATEAQRWDAPGAHGVLTLRGGFSARLPAGQIDPFPWLAEGQTARIKLVRQALVRNEDGTRPAWDQVAHGGEISGNPARAGRVVERPKDRRGLSCEQITLGEGRARARGRVKLEAGTFALEADELTGAPADGTLESAGPVVVEILRPLRTGPSELYRIEGGRARARFAAEPSAWERARVERRSLKKRDLRLVASSVLRDLAVDDGVHLRGPRQLDVRAGALRYDAERALAQLEPEPGQPITLSWDEGQLVTGSVTLWQRASWPQPRYLLSARGGLAGELQLADPAEGLPPVHVEAGWLLLDVLEPRDARLRDEARDDARRAALLGYGLGGPAGVLVRGQDRSQIGWEAWAARVVGNGQQGTLLGGADQPLRLQRGELELHTDRAEARFLPDQQLALDLPTGFRGALPFEQGEGGQTEGGRLSLVLNRAEARGGRRPLESDRAFARRLLARLEVEGGLRLDGERLRVRADTATLEDDGTYRVRGTPALVSRHVDDGWVTSRGNELILRLQQDP